MSFANSGAPLNSYRPDTRLINAIAALTQRVEVLEAEKTAIQAENAELRAGLEALIAWAETLTTNESSGASG